MVWDIPRIVKESENLDRGKGDWETKWASAAKWMGNKSKGKAALCHEKRSPT